MNHSVFWIRIYKDPELLPDPEPLLEGFGSGSRSISENGCKHEQKPLKNGVFHNFDHFYVPTKFKYSLKILFLIAILGPFNIKFHQEKGRFRNLNFLLVGFGSGTH
jgi:hypothetical protein